MQRGGFWSSIVGDNLNMDLRGGGLGVAHLYVPVPIALKRAGVKQGKGRVMTGTVHVLLDEPCVRILSLGVFVEVAQPGMGGSCVQVEVILLHVLPMVALLAGKAKGTLLENRIATVPQPQGKTESLLLVANTTHTILVPAVGSGTSLVMIKIFPRCALPTIVLPYGPPTALSQIGTP